MKKQILIIVIIALLLISKQAKNASQFSMEYIDALDTIDSNLKTYGFSRNMRAAIMAVVAKESGFKPQWEIGYKNTSNARIRSIFGLSELSDQQIETLKKSDYDFFSYVYGSRKPELGNTNPGDGYKYRGSGFNQLTGKANYENMSKIIGVDIVSNPELNNTLKVASKTLGAFFYNALTSKKGIDKAKILGGKYNDLDLLSSLKLAANVNAGLGNSLDSSNVQNAFSKAKKYVYSIADQI